MKSGRLRSDERIRRRADFQQAYEHGVRIRGRYCTVFVLPTNHGVGRLGIAVSRKLGGAVQRNRAKRLIREVFRRNKILDGFDVIVVPRRDVLEANLAALETDYRNILKHRVAERP